MHSVVYYLVQLDNLRVPALLHNGDLSSAALQDLYYCGPLHEQCFRCVDCPVLEKGHEPITKG